MSESTRPTTSEVSPESDLWLATGAADSPSVSFGQFLQRLLIAGNPFYIISALVTIFGISRFCSAEAVESGFLLPSLLAGYTLLIALGAVLVLRLGRVWEDGRSLLGLILLMFPILSAGLDELVVGMEGKNEWVFVAGLLFSVGLAESVLHSIRLPLNLRMRLPMHGILALLFLYPLFLSRTLTRTPAELLDVTVATRVMGFPILFSILLTGFLPALMKQKGTSVTSKPACPYPWPAYPWAIPLLLMVGGALRTRSLCLSYLPISGLHNPFGLYMLLPMVFPLSLLGFELARKMKSTAWERLAVSLPGVSLLTLPILLTGKSNGQTMLSLLGMSSRMFGCCFLAALILFYLYAAIRRAPHADQGILFGLGILGLIHLNPSANGIDGRWLLGTTPLMLAAGLAFALSLLHRQSVYALTGLVFLLPVVGITCRILDFYPVATSVHTFLAGCLLIGGFYPDEGAEKLRQVGAAMIIILATVTVAYTSHGDLALLAGAGFLLTYSLVSGLYYLWKRDPLCLIAFITSASLMILGAGKYSFDHLRHLKWRQGSLPMAAGLALFGVGLTVSIWKALKKRHETPGLPTSSDHKENGTFCNEIL